MNVETVVLTATKKRISLPHIKKCQDIAFCLKFVWYAICCDLQFFGLFTRLPRHIYKGDVYDSYPPGRRHYYRTYLFESNKL